MARAGLRAEDMAFLDRVVAAKKRGAPPVQAVSLPLPIAAITHFNEWAQQERAKRAQKGYVLAQSMAAPVRHDAVPPVSTLRPCTLREIAPAINKLTADRVLFARVLGPPAEPAFRMGPSLGTNALLVDNDGDVIFCSLYNFLLPEQEPAEVLAPGRYLALLQPYMKRSGDVPEGMLMLRCDHPRAVRLFRTEAEWLQAQGRNVPAAPPLTVESMQQRGKEAMKAGLLEEAIAWCTDALSLPAVSPQLRAALLAMRSECRLRVEHFADALCDVDAVLALDARNDACRTRRVTALLMLHRYDEAVRAIEDCSPPERAELVLDAQRLRREHELGLYDEATLVAEARKERAPRLHADYSANEAAYVSHDCIGGRGVRAARALEPDTLILASKAFLYTGTDEDAPESLMLNPYTNFMSKGTSSGTLLQRAMLKLCTAPLADRRAFFSLSGGVASGADESETLPMNRIDAIIGCNSFAAAQHPIAAAVDKIVMQAKLGRELKQEDWERLAMKGSGLWIQASLFNHSCCPNADYYMIGEQLFLRTSRAVAKGEEICVSYVSPDLLFAERQEKLSTRHGGFVCNCSRCSVCLENPEVPRLEKKIYDLYAKCCLLRRERELKPVTKLLRPAERAVICQTFLALPPSCRLWFHRLCELEAGEAIVGFGNYRSAIEWLDRALQVFAECGGVTPHEKQRTYITQAGCFLRLKLRDEARQRLVRARELCGCWLPVPTAETFVALCDNYAMIDSELAFRLAEDAVAVNAAYKARSGP